ncbi:hypothetical protein BN1263170238 [Stenotrophomonas maltophilia]|nr:hypothetical protein BN1263170238 [Stenotrophomonas maltophilia]
MKLCRNQRLKVRRPFGICDY